jgi:hypothetical protein
VRSPRPLQDHYATLGVSRTASWAEIRTARNRLLRRFHPDLNPNDVVTAQEKTVSVLLAAKVLLDEEARREYDRHYSYIYGNASLTGDSPSAEPDGEQPDYVVCDSCRRRSHWGRSYCIYCGAPTPVKRSRTRASRPSDNDVEVVTPRMQERAPRSWSEAGLNFGCGAAFGAFVSTSLGFRLIAAAGFEHESSFVFVVVAYAVGIGAAAAVWGERFWSKKRFFLLILGLYVSTLLLLPVMRLVRRWTQDDGKTLLVTAVILLACGALTATLRRRRRF